MKKGAYFALTAVALTLAAAWLLGLVFDGPDEQRAIWLSALVAVTVQIGAFTVTALLRKEHVMLGWGLGVLVRLMTLAIYGLVVVRALALPASAALISLVTFLFLSTLVEPLFLRS